MSQISRSWVALSLLTSMGAVLTLLVLSMGTPTCASGFGLPGGGGAGGMGGNGGTGGTGGIGGASTSEDLCPGEPVALPLEGQVTLSGATRGLDHDYRAYCGDLGDRGRDAVYALEIGAAGTLRVTLDAVGGHTGALYARTSCTDPSSIVGCVDGATATAAGLVLAVQPGPLHVFVDGDVAGDASYLIVFDLKTADLCNDGVINAPPGSDSCGVGGGSPAGTEDCDFGAADANDGCTDDTCKYEALPPGDTSNRCPGADLGALGPGTTAITLSSLFPNPHNTAYCDDHDAPCCGPEGSCPLSGGHDRVFRVNTADGVLTAKVTGGNFDAVLSVYQTCNVTDHQLASLLACSDSAEQLADEQVELPVSGTEQYFIVVDGYSAKSFGAFELQLTWKAGP